MSELSVLVVAILLLSISLMAASKNERKYKHMKRDYEVLQEENRRLTHKIYYLEMQDRRVARAVHDYSRQNPKGPAR